MINLDIPVIETKKETPDVKTIKLEKPQSFDYKPGQYMMMELETGDEDNIKPFSLASSPTEKALMISTKISQSNFKKKFDSLKVNDIVKLKGPMGIFVLNESAKNIMMLSGGIGITPLRNMIKYAADKKLDNKITLLYSNKTPQDIVYKEEWPILEQQNPNFKIINTITENLEGWHGRTGRINETLIRACNDLQNTSFYICGPPGMVNGLSDVLNGMGIPQQNVKVERFIGY